MVAYLDGVHPLRHRGICVDAVITFLHILNIISQRERKLDRLKSEFQGADNEAPTCVVPMHAQQMISLWQGVGEVSSACEVGWRGRVQPRP